MWFLPGVMRLLWDYDSNLPYAISDFGAIRATVNASNDICETPCSVLPSCLPCHFDTERSMAAMHASHTQLSVPAVNIPKRCPCTPEDACGFTREACSHNVTRSDPAHETAAERERIGAFCRILKKGVKAEHAEFPPHRNVTFPCERPWFHGGAGVIVSQGLFSLLAEDAEYEVRF